MAAAGTWYPGDPADLLVAAEDLADLLAARRPEWHAHAACRGLGTEMFFPERGEDARPAKAVCSGCPVAAPCGAATGDHGIWGGMSPRERMRGRRAA